MKETLISILSCPVCRGSLTRNHKDSHDNDEPHGKLVCEKCAATYSVKQDLPRLYLDDDGIIERSGHSKHSEYVLDRNRIDVLVRTTRKRTKKPSLGFFYKRVSILAIIGWILLAVSGRWSHWLRNLCRLSAINRCFNLNRRDSIRGGL